MALVQTDNLPNNLREHPRCMTCGRTMDYIGKITIDGRQVHRFEPVSCKHLHLSNYMEFDMNGDRVERATKAAPEWWNDDDFEKVIDLLKITYPHLNVSWGYVGGCEPNGSRDYRQWYVWCKSQNVRMWFENYDYGRAQGHMRFFLGSTQEYQERFREQLKTGRFFQWLDLMESRHQSQ